MQKVEEVTCDARIEDEADYGIFPEHVSHTRYWVESVTDCQGSRALIYYCCI
jgi:hypothetical protein